MARQYARPGSCMSGHTRSEVRPRALSSPAACARGPSWGGPVRDWAVAEPATTLASIATAATRDLSTRTRMTLLQDSDLSAHRRGCLHLTVGPNATVVTGDTHHGRPTRAGQRMDQREGTLWLQHGDGLWSGPRRGD